MTGYLDTLLIYLRLVHSIDFYNYHQYSNEDQMPNKFGLIHVRGPVKDGKLLKKDVECLMKTREEKFKDVENEVEIFIKANIHEVGSGKFFCPLSGKKFKGEDYVRKHIVSRFDDKLEDVRKQTQYFNNYLKDPKRPQPNRKFETKKPRTRVTFETPKIDVYHRGGQRSREDSRYMKNWRGRFNNVFDKRPKVDYNDMEIFKYD